MSGAFRIGVLGVFDWLNADGPRVLAYHGVVSGNSAPFTGTDLSEWTLRRHLELLKGRYDVVPLREVGRRRRSVAITFDDGSLSDLRRAVPILGEYGVSATFFICSDLVAGARAWTWNDEAWLTGWASAPVDPLARGEAASRFAHEFEAHVRQHRIADPYAELEIWQARASITKADLHRAAAIDPVRFSPLRHDQVRALIDAGHEVGSHTASHPVLSFVSADPQATTRELRDSRVALQDCTGEAVDAFSYPFGGPEDVDAATVAAVRRAGYQRAYLNIVVPGRSAFELGRVPAPAGPEAAPLFAATSGFRHFVQTGRRMTWGRDVQ